VNPERLISWFKNFGGAVTQSLTPTQLLSLVLTFAAVVGLTVGAAYWMSAPTYRVLFSDMDPESAATVVEQLRTREVQFQLDPGGRTVRVPATELDQLRLEFASEGMPSSGRIGFEIFDRTAFGATEFLEQVNFRRALEGEIARTITTLSEVSGARVHISMERKAVFGRTETPAKASVVLKLRNSGPLSAESVKGISNLVSAGVEGLQPQAVVIVDSYGRALNATNDAEADGVPGIYTERRDRLERDLTGRVVSLLEPVVGTGRVRANVAVSLRSETAEATEELWDPQATVVRSRHVSGDSEFLSASAEGVAGSRANLPPPVVSSAPTEAAGSDEADLLAAPTDLDVSDAEEPPDEAGADGTPELQLASTDVGQAARGSQTTNYEISKSITRTIRPAGDVARLSVAVILDDQLVANTDEDGAQTFSTAARSPEDVEKIRSLVAAAVGLDPARGDLLTVENVAFEETLEADVIEPSLWEQYLPQIIEAVRILGVLLLAVAAFFFGIRPLIRRLSAVQAAGAGTAQLQGGLTAAQLNEAESMSPRGRLDALNTHANTLSSKEPENAARLVRAWLGEEKR
jgi:flagellar M-ring protein FliF